MCSKCRHQPIFNTEHNQRRQSNSSFISFIDSKLQGLWVNRKSLFCEYTDACNFTSKQFLYFLLRATIRSVTKHYTLWFWKLILHNEMTHLSWKKCCSAHSTHLTPESLDYINPSTIPLSISHFHQCRLRFAQTRATSEYFELRLKHCQIKASIS